MCSDLPVGSLVPVPREKAMTCISLVIAVAVALSGPWYPPEKSPETEAQRADRVSMIGEHVGVEARRIAKNDEWEFSDRALASVALWILWSESWRFRVDVHSGEYGGDGGKARCLGQLHAGGWVTRVEWLESAGTDEASTRLCVQLTMRVIVRHAARCKLRGKFTAMTAATIYAAYGTGHSCDPRHDSPTHGKDWALRRTHSWRFIHGALAPP